jgi:hypothetical protein
MRRASRNQWPVDPMSELIAHHDRKTALQLGHVAA